MTEILSAYPITHAGLAPFQHPRLSVETNAQTAVRYLRFLRPARLERLELPYSVYGRWVPDVPTHPAHLLVSTLDPVTNQWKLVREVDLPLDSRILGEGLSQEMSVLEMNAHFQKVLASPPRVIEMGGLVSDHLRVECDREHPVWPNHGECNGGPYNVPFGILDPLKVYGEWVDGSSHEPVYTPGLKRGEYSPAAPDGMQVYERLGVLFYEGPRLKVGFSLRRPLLMHLGWDDVGDGLAGTNRLGISQANWQHPVGLIGGLSGPLLRGLREEYGAQLWTGELSVQGNQVSYRGLRCGVAGLELEAIFTIESDRLVFELHQRCERPVAVLEWEAWRFLWDLRAGMTAAAAQPTLLPGRNGEVRFPLLWASDGGGCLGMRLIDGDPQETRFQVESYRNAFCVTGGVVLAPRPEPGDCLVIPAGEHRAVLELAVTNLEPETGQSEFPAVFKRHWSSVFSCFRPEYGGFSNHAAAVNCHVNQHGPLEITAHTRKHPSGTGSAWPDGIYHRARLLRWWRLRLLSQPVPGFRPDIDLSGGSHLPGGRGHCLATTDRARADRGNRAYGRDNRRGRVGGVPGFVWEQRFVPLEHECHGRRWFWAYRRVCECVQLSCLAQRGRAAERTGQARPGGALPGAGYRHPAGISSSANQSTDRLDRRVAQPGWNAARLCLFMDQRSSNRLWFVG